MYKVRYTLEALAHLDVIHSYIEPRNPLAAQRVIARIRAAADRLGEFPNIGHRGLVAGTHEWSVKGLPYIIVHELNMGPRGGRPRGISRRAGSRKRLI